jgi:serine/threonine protein kinase/tetratricopeptide (TPR) repeat protein
MNEPAPVLYGKYQLLDLLARGGMAEVYKAKSHGVEGFEKILVIKRILPELSENPQFVEMFINEAKIAVTLSHANIVQVFDLGRAEDTYFIAMEYVAGYDLATILERGARLKRPMPQELAVYVVSELAKGLDYAHRRRDGQLRPLNIVHRDVSPQNVLISFEGEVKLTDFGIAKAALAVEERTDVGVLKGKYAYMSPEQARGEDVDARTDLFALGTVLYELLGGENPFYVPESTYETLRKVRDGELTPLRDEMPELPEELCSIVERAMSPSADERHPNAGHLYEELVQFLYSSGRRVSGHDLADYLQELRRASEMERQPSDDAKLRAVFDQEAGSAPAYSPEATPVEVPVARTGARRSSQAPRKSPSSVIRPTQERRDVTTLVVQSAEPTLLSDPVVERLLRRFGGQAVDWEPPPGTPPTLLALFGLRDPDGRDTEHAARFGLRLLRSVRSGTQVGRPDAKVHVGVHCGRMLVDVEGHPVRDDAFDALGARARELAERAAPGQVWVSEEGRRAIAGLFVTSRAGEGAAAPWVVEDERSLADASGKFVGRREELRRMGELLAAANRGRMKVIGIAGEAGSGKTRLLLETRRRLELGGHDVGMYLATCARQNRRVPLAAMQEMLRAVLGIDELEAEDEAREKVGRMRELGLSPAEIAAISVTLGLEPEEDAEGEGVDNPAQLVRPALGRMALKLAEDRLTVFAWDGAESMDEESQQLLDWLIRDTRDARIGVVLSYRPGFVHAWSDVPSYFELPLGPMSDEDVARLTATRLAAEEVPLELLREVTAKSGGNPLYVEEYLKALADAGAIRVRDGRVDYDPEVAEVEVPKTLRGIVSSRLARLGPTDRHLLQVASVAGERFTSDLLAEVSGEDPGAVADALEVLARRGLVTKGQNEYDFSHELVGEVLRDGLTLESRRELHAAVAEALEQLYPRRLDELAEKLAAHHREAGDRERAVDFLVRAADRLEGEHSLAGAVAALERAVELLGQMAQPDRDRTIELYRRIGDLCFRSRDLEDGAERMGAAVELCEALGRDADVARFSMMRGRLMVNVPGSSEDGRRWLDRAADLARQLGDERLLRDVVLATAEADIRLGEHRSAAEHFEEALRLAREAGDVEAQTRCLIPLALASASDGRLERALGALAEARKLTGADPDRFTECELAKMEALVRFFANDYEACLEAGGRALELAKEYGFPYEQAVNAHNMGEAYLRLGDYKRAFASLRFSYEMSRDHGWSKLQWANMRVLGFIDATRFGSKEGRSHVVQANEFAESHGFVWDVIQGRYYLAIIDQGRGDEDAARQGLREILRLAADHGHRDYVSAAEKALKALDAGSTIQLPG